MIVENTEDATAAFYAENSKLQDRLVTSDTVSRIMMLNTEMTAAEDAIQYSGAEPLHGAGQAKDRGHADRCPGTLQRSQAY